MFSTITTAPSTTMPKSSAPRESRLAGNAFQLQAGGGEQQRKRNGQGDDDGAAHVAQEQQQDDHHQDDAFGQVVQHGMGGVVHQLAAVDEGNNFHARRQDVIVQLLHFCVNALQRRFRVGALAHGHDAGNHVVVVDDLAVFAVDGARELAQPDLRPLRHHRDILHAQRRAALGGEDRVFDVVDVAAPGRLRAR